MVADFNIHNGTALLPAGDHNGSLLVGRSPDLGVSQRAVPVDRRQPVEARSSLAGKDTVPPYQHPRTGLEVGVHLLEPGVEGWVRRGDHPFGVVNEVEVLVLELFLEEALIGVGVVESAEEVEPVVETPEQNEQALVGERVVVVTGLGRGVGQVIRVDVFPVETTEGGISAGLSGEESGDLLGGQVRPDLVDVLAVPNEEETELVLPILLSVSPSISKTLFSGVVVLVLATVLHQHDAALGWENALHEIGVFPEELPEVGDVLIVGTPIGEVHHILFVHEEEGLEEGQRLIGSGPFTFAECRDIDSVSGVEGEGGEATLELIREAQSVFDGSQRGLGPLIIVGGEVLDRSSDLSGLSLEPSSSLLIDGDDLLGAFLHSRKILRLSDEGRHGRWDSRSWGLEQWDVWRTRKKFLLKVIDLHLNLEHFPLADHFGIGRTFEKLEEFIEQEPPILGLVVLILPGELRGMGCDDDGMQFVVGVAERLDKVDSVSR